MTRKSKNVYLAKLIGVHTQKGDISYIKYIFKCKLKHLVSICFLDCTLILPSEAEDSK